MGVEGNREAARQLFDEAAASDVALAQLTVGESLIGSPDAADRARGRALLTKAAQAGSLSAGFRLADADKGDVEAFQKLADQGFAEAHSWVYRLLADKGGRMTPADRTTATAALTGAAEAGSPEAQALLAAEYYQLTSLFPIHLGLKRDYPKAFHWATLAADQNEAIGHEIVSLLYLWGDGTKQNVAKATEHHDIVYMKLKPKNDAAYFEVFLEFYMAELEKRDGLPKRPE